MDFGKPCNDIEGCTYHNLQCSYPNCAYGIAQNAQKVCENCQNEGWVWVLQASVSLSDVKEINEKAKRIECWVCK